MSDRETMVEHIQAAMHALDQAHAAKESLHEKTDRETIENFQIKMKELHRRLEQMQAILAHEDTYTLDELSQAVGAALSHRETYQRIPHYEVKSKN